MRICCVAFILLRRLHDPIVRISIIYTHEPSFVDPDNPPSYASIDKPLGRLPPLAPVSSLLITDSDPNAAEKKKKKKKKKRQPGEGSNARKGCG